MHPLLNIAINAARNAGNIITRHAEQLERVIINKKGANDFFTDIDVKAEQTIINTIHKAYPNHGILAEESGAQNLTSDTIWIIDPLDGTNNYIHGLPFYAVSIAVQIKNRIEHAVTYDPIRHECFSASRGNGAQLNDRRLRVSKQNSLAEALLATGLHCRNKESALRALPTLATLFGKCSGIRQTGSATLDLAYVASGRLDGVWLQGMQPWDLAAGGLLIQEAGGLLCDWQGQDKYLETGNIIAGSPKVFKQLREAMENVTL